MLVYKPLAKYISSGTVDSIGNVRASVFWQSMSKFLVNSKWMRYYKGQKILGRARNGVG